MMFCSRNHFLSFALVISSLLFAFGNAALMKRLGYASTGDLKVKFKLAAGNVVERVLSPHITETPFQER